MSVLGPNLGAVNLAASITGTLRNPAAADRVTADQAAQKLQADRVQMATRDLDDALESDLSHGQVADRDADGREPWAYRQRPDNPDEPDDPDAERTPPLEDDRGRTLDLNA